MADKACYLIHGSKLGRSASVPCGVTNSTVPNVPCCVAGDTCLSNGLCAYTHSLTEGSGYYVSDCTDPTFDAPGCRTSCNDQYLSDVVWDNAAQIWKCCAYTPTLNCSHPSNKQFNAPAPSRLASLQYIPSNGIPTYPVAAATASSTTASEGSSSSTTTPASSAASAASSNASQASTGLSSGAQAGIGVGVALGVLLLIAIAALLFWRKKRQNRKEPQRMGEMASTPVVGQNDGNTAYKYAENAPEYQSGTGQAARHTSPSELHSEIPPQELSGKPLGR